MNVGEYVRYKTQAFEAVKAAYDSLASEHEAVILEGAGSPGEVNLKRHDIVNMGMARYAGAPVFLPGILTGAGFSRRSSERWKCSPSGSGGW
jgi:cobyric acid synthase